MKNRVLASTLITFTVLSIFVGCSRTQNPTSSDNDVQAKRTIQLLHPGDFSSPHFQLSDAYTSVALPPGPHNAGWYIVSWEVASRVVDTTEYLVDFGTTQQTYVVAGDATLYSESIVVYLDEDAIIIFRLPGTESSAALTGTRATGGANTTSCIVYFDCYEGGVTIESGT